MYSALHECGHVSLWRNNTIAPQPHEAITCGHCGEATRVRLLVGPWRVKCMTCRRIDHTYTLAQTSEAIAVRHLQTWSTHRVRLWQWGDPQSVKVWTVEQTGIQPQLISDAPF